MTNDALRTILPIAGWSEDRAGAVEITGQADPILPTPFRLGETSTATLAAVGLAASDLWELRTGRQQEVAVDSRQATASLRSGHYLKIDGAAVSPAPNAVMGMYPAKHGRWSYLHCNFPNHRAAALLTPEAIQAEAASLGGALGLLADRIFADADHPDQAARQVAGLLRLGQLHGTVALQAAATAALSANVRSYRFVQHLLAKGRIDALEDPAGGLGPHANLRGPAYYH